MQPAYEQTPQEEYILPDPAVSCPKCGTLIPEASFTSTGGVAQCPACPAAVRLVDRTEFPLLEYPAQALPKGITLEMTDQRLTLSNRRFKWSVIFPLIFGIGLSMPLFMALFTWQPDLFFLPFGWIGLPFLCHALIRVFNQTITQVTPAQITIKHRPFTVWFDKVIGVERIKQLYVIQVRHKNKNSVWYTYELWMQYAKQGRSRRLISGMVEADPAFFLEQEMERFLGIKDKAVRGEHSTSTPTEHLEDWEQYAKNNNFNFVKGKTLEGSRVWGEYQDTDMELIAFYENKRKKELATRLTLTTKTPLKITESISLKRVQDAFELMTEKYAFGQVVGLDMERGQMYWEQPGVLYQHPYLFYAVETLSQWLKLTPDIIALGGEVMPILTKVAVSKNHPLRKYAWQLMTLIAPSTRNLQDRADSLVCQRCITACTLHNPMIGVSKGLSYYGCRTCDQSKDFYDVNTVIAILDKDFGDQPVQEGDTLRVNWLVRRTLFDFGTVAIVNASDEDIERFAVQVGNDTDPVRKPLYSAMTCHVLRRIDPSTLRILKRTFGQVVIDE